MIFFEDRLTRESIIVSAMIKKYCKSNHSQVAANCTQCSDLLNYSNKRLFHCKFGNQKPACKQCKVHCYSPEKRESIRVIMRWAGPRMLYSHPIFALMHFIDNATATKNSKSKK